MNIGKNQINSLLLVTGNEKNNAINQETVGIVVAKLYLQLFIT